MIKTSTKITLEESYNYCRQLAKKEAKNFYYSFLLLPQEKRQSICAIYAFMRESDNISDNPNPDISTKSDMSTKKEAFNAWRSSLRNAYNGYYGESLIFPAFHDTVKKYNIPIEYFEELINGTEMDLFIASYDTFKELYKYCYKVAGVVGLVCLHLYGFKDDKAKELAEALGIAFQLTNILRDIKEDLLMDRIYLPQEDLVRFSYSREDLKNSVYDERFIALMEFQVNRASSYYKKGEELIKFIDLESRTALSAIIGIYKGVFKKIIANKYIVFNKRIKLSLIEKLSIVAKACWETAS